MRGGRQTCSGSCLSFLDRLEVSEFKVQKKHANRGGGASPQVRLLDYLSAFLCVCELFVCLPVCLSGVDDAESECGLDSGVEFDWIITNEADAPSLEEQLQPILKLAEEAADQQSY